MGYVTLANNRKVPLRIYLLIIFIYILQRERSNYSCDRLVILNLSYVLTRLIVVVWDNISKSYIFKISGSSSLIVSKSSFERAMEQQALCICCSYTKYLMLQNLHQSHQQSFHTNSHPFFKRIALNGREIAFQKSVSCRLKHLHLSIILIKQNCGIIIQLLHFIQFLSFLQPMQPQKTFHYMLNDKKRRKQIQQK